MIKVKIKANNLTVKGHSGYSVAGSDIVCAAVSMLMTSTVNAILRFDDKAILYEDEKGFLSIDILEEDSRTQTLIENCIDLLEQLEENYPKYIKIERE